MDETADAELPSDSSAAPGAASSHPAPAGRSRVVVVVQGRGDDAGDSAGRGGDTEMARIGHAAAHSASASAHTDADSDDVVEDPAHRIVLPSVVCPLLANMTEFEYVGTSGRKITLLDGFDGLPLKRLTVRSNLLRSMSGLASVAPSLEYLELYDNQIGAIADLSGAALLATLDLSFNKIRAVGPSLNGCASLTILFLGGNRLSSLDGLQACVGLTRLDVGANKIRSLDPIAGLVKLEELWAGKNKLSHVGDALTRLTRLTKLDLQSNRLVTIEGLHACADLSELYLSHNGLRSLDGLQGCRALSTLDVSANAIEHITPGAVSHLRCLTDLWVGYNSVKSFDSVIPALTALSALRVVYLEHNPIAADFEYRLRLAREVPQLVQIDATPCRHD